MAYELKAGDDSSCELIERAAGATISNTTPIPLSKAAVLAIMRDLFSNAENKEIVSGAVCAERMRDGIRIKCGITHIALTNPIAMEIMVNA